jgi:chloramphenicol-sensitive protein RarD
VTPASLDRQCLGWALIEAVLTGKGRSMQNAENRDTKAGFIYAGLAYLIWGFLPLYLKALGNIPAYEIVPHRIVWSLPVCLAIVWATGQMHELRSILNDPRKMGNVLITSLLITVNWLIYVWAIANGHALESALGYYINPLLSIVLAAVLLGEKLSPLKWVAVGLAAMAVAVLTIEARGLPLISLGLALTWGIYAYRKKTLPVSATAGFTLEIVILTVPALLMWGWLESRGASSFGHGGLLETLLLAGTGFVTAIPLVLYANGAKLLRLTTIAMMQYLPPTMIFLIAVFIFKEPFSQAKLVAFLLIWAALAVYTWSLIRSSKAVTEGT